jgi:c-di-GMP phosphodiesterase
MTGSSAPCGEAPNQIGSTGASQSAEFTRYLARQPILDARGRLFAYELLFRANQRNVFSGDGDMATRTMLDNLVLFGAEQLCAGALAFINCTRESLVGQFVEVLPASRVVLEILENIQPDDELLQAVRKLKARGFRIALDDFSWSDAWEPLTRIADFIKVDFITTGMRERRELRARLQHSPAALVAEKVETIDDYHTAYEEGFALFQGYYFCRPRMMANRGVPANRLLQIELLGALHQPDFDLNRITQMVMRDTAITYRLLRLVNSPLYATCQEISSVHAALIAVGETAFRRIATLAITSELSQDAPPEILHMTFARARFCELAAARCGLDANEQYLVGLLSLVPAMLKVPMEPIAEALPLRPPIRKALEGEANTERCLLAWAEAAEAGDWSACDALAAQIGLTPQDVPLIASQAMVWAEHILCSAL